MSVHATSSYPYHTGDPDTKKIVNLVEDTPPVDVRIFHMR